MTDLGDSIYDTTVFLDHFRFLKTSSVASISDFGTCGPPGHKTPQWGPFGKKPTLEFDSGGRLEVECAPVSANEIAFKMWYTSPTGKRNRVGLCAFEGGCNTAEFVYSGDSNGNGRPDSLIRTRWISRDYSQNDNPNPWNGRSNESPPVLDWAETVFDAPANAITKTDYAWSYNVPPPILNACRVNPNPKPEGKLAFTPRGPTGRSGDGGVLRRGLGETGSSASVDRANDGGGYRIL